MKASLGGRTVAVGILLTTGTPFWAAGKARADISFTEIQKFSARKILPFDSRIRTGIPRWSGFPDEQRQTIYWYDKKPGVMGEGFLAELFTHVGQWGTYVAPPAHFVKGLRTVDQIDLKEMILPLACIDVHQECQKNSDYTLSLERAKKWEGGTGKSGRRLCRDAPRSVKALAGRGEDGEQRQSGCSPISGLEFTRSEILVRRAQNHRLRTRPLTPTLGLQHQGRLFA